MADEKKPTNPKPPPPTAPPVKMTVPRDISKGTFRRQPEARSMLGPKVPLPPVPTITPPAQPQNTQQSTPAKTEDKK
jgi:hypothetical protein